MRSAAERQRLPVAVWHARNETLATRQAPAMPDHLGRNRRLVDEDEARCGKPGLPGLQFGTRCSDIRTILFSGVQSFLNVMSWRS